MSLKGGSSKTKESQTSQSTQSGTQTNTQSLDPWSQNQFETQSGGILGAVNDYNATPYKAFSGPLVAGLTPAETEARKLASANVGKFNGILGDAEGIVRNVSGAGPTTSILGAAKTVNAPTLGAAQTYDAAQVGNMDQIGNRLGEIDKYQNPGLQRVVDTTLASYDEDAARAKAAMAARAAANGAFGGSRYGVAEGVFAADTGRNRAATEAGLRSDEYGRALNLLGSDVNAVNQGRLTQAQLNQQAAADAAAARNQFTLNQGNLDFSANTFNAGAENARDSERAAMDFAGRESDAARQLQSAGILGNLAQQQQSISQQDVQTLRQLGLDERAIQQAQIDAEMAAYDREAADRLQRLQLELSARSGILGATPMLVNTTGTANQSNTGSSSGTSKTSGFGWGVDASQVGKLFA